MKDNPETREKLATVLSNALSEVLVEGEEQARMVEALVEEILALESQEPALSRAEVEILADKLGILVTDENIITEEEIEEDEEETAVQAEEDVKQEKRRGEGV